MMKFLSILSLYSTFTDKIVDDRIEIKERQKVGDKMMTVVTGTMSIYEKVLQFEEQILPFPILRAEILERIDNEDDTHKWCSLELIDTEMMKQAREIELISIEKEIREKTLEVNELLERKMTLKGSELLSVK